jgi:hypothetical protein
MKYVVCAMVTAALRLGSIASKIFYVCCPPCTDQIEADPKTYLQKLDELYLASLKTLQEAVR